MPALKLIGLAALAALLMTGSALAITPITTQQEKVREEIAQQLGSNRSFALVIGISEFDDPAWDDLGGIGREVTDVTRAFAEQGFRVTTKTGRIDRQYVPFFDPRVDAVDIGQERLARSVIQRLKRQLGRTMQP